MEFKQVMGIILACMLVCVVVGVSSVIQSHREKEKEQEPVEIITAPKQTTTTDYWQYFHENQPIVPSETTTVTDVTGMPAETGTSIPGDETVVSSDLETDSSRMDQPTETTATTTVPAEPPVLTGFTFVIDE